MPWLVSFPLARIGFKGVVQPICGSVTRHSWFIDLNLREHVLTLSRDIAAWSALRAWLLRKERTNELTNGANHELDYRSKLGTAH
jgi:hypothetical protein